MNKLIEIYDVTILEGHRSEKKQNDYFNGGKSKVQYPDSRHNRSILLKRDDMSDAVDAAPWHSKKPNIRWDDLKSFCYMAGLIKGIAAAYNIPIRQGIDWDKDGEIITDQSFNDYPHTELSK
jgi:peptidoglycan L-alanyl-D-glutamate endopeptidase CwlK